MLANIIKRQVQEYEYIIIMNKDCFATYITVNFLTFLALCTGACTSDKPKSLHDKSKRRGRFILSRKKYKAL